MSTKRKAKTTKTTKATKKPKSKSKLTKAEKLKAQAERLLIEASEAEDEEDEVEDDSDDEQSDLYTESALKKMKPNEVRLVAKGLGLTTKGVKKADLISEILDVQSIEDDEIDEEDDSDSGQDVDFSKVGSFDRDSGDFQPEKDFKRFMSSIDFKTMKIRHFERLTEKDDFDWFIIATDVTKRKKEDGIFMRLSSSGNAFIFYIHERLFTIPLNQIIDPDPEYEDEGINVFEVEFQ